MAVRHSRASKPRPPLDPEALERLALHYCGRYATTRAKLAAYLRRKLKERGWEGGSDPPVEALIERFAAAGYVDDRAFASARAQSLGRRGYGERRVAEALHAAGIEEPDAAEARAESRAGAWAAALRFVQRRRLGPFAERPLERDAARKAMAAMLRAGHPIDLARRLLDAPPGIVPDPDVN